MLAYLAGKWSILALNRHVISRVQLTHAKWAKVFRAPYDLIPPSPMCDESKCSHSHSHSHARVPDSLLNFESSSTGTVRPASQSVLINSPAQRSTAPSARMQRSLSSRHLTFRTFTCQRRRRSRRWRRRRRRRRRRQQRRQAELRAMDAARELIVF